MLAFARETRLSETTYVQAASAAGADYATGSGPWRASCVRRASLARASRRRRGVIGDPATGSAAGPLLAYLRERDAAADELTVHQGVEMGRPSRIDCAWERDRPRVSGDVVVVADGHLLHGD